MADVYESILLKLPVPGVPDRGRFILRKNRKTIVNFLVNIPTNMELEDYKEKLKNDYLNPPEPTEEEKLEESRGKFMGMVDRISDNNISTGFYSKTLGQMHNYSLDPVNMSMLLGLAFLINQGNGSSDFEIECTGSDGIPTVKSHNKNQVLDLVRDMTDYLYKSRCGTSEMRKQVRDAKTAEEMDLFKE